MISQSKVSAEMLACNQLNSALISEHQVAIHHHHDGKQVVTSVVQAVVGPEGLEWQQLDAGCDTEKAAIGGYRQLLTIFNDGVGLSMNLPVSFVANLAANYAVRHGGDPTKAAKQGCVEVLRLFRTHPGQSEQAIMATLAMDGFAPNHAGAAYFLELATQLIENDALLTNGLPESLVNAYQSGDLNSFSHEFAADLLANPMLLHNVSNVDVRTYDHMVTRVNELPVDTEGNFYNQQGASVNKAVLLKSLEGLPTNEGVDKTVSMATLYKLDAREELQPIKNAVMNAGELEIMLLEASRHSRDFQANSCMVPDGHAAIIDLPNDEFLLIDNIGNQHINAESFKSLVSQFKVATVSIGSDCLNTLGTEDHTKRPQPSSTLG
tara:strand:- start:47 stop:1183 length:1137 start_codon:yes stop_codon:yes gene_type:complete